MADNASEERALELWESMFGDNSKVTAGYFTVTYKSFVKKVNDYAAQQAREAIEREYKSLKRNDGVAAFSMDGKKNTVIISYDDINRRLAELKGERNDG